MPSLPQWPRRFKRTTSVAHTPSGGVSTTHLTALEGPSVPVGADPTNPNIGVGAAVKTNIAGRGASLDESKPSDTSIVGGNGWLALKEALKTLKEMSVGALAPLQTVLTAVLAVMNHVEVLYSVNLIFRQYSRRHRKLAMLNVTYSTWLAKSSRSKTYSIPTDRRICPP